MSSSLNLSQLLTKLRAPIFNTLPALTNARTGTKYLRRRLRGPSILAYNPTPINLTSLNAPTKWNKYLGWDGMGGGKGMLGKDEIVSDGFEEVGRGRRPGPPVRSGVQVVKAGWVENGQELIRFEDVARKKRIGKGPPKKGQGRRSQMKKK